MSPRAAVVGAGWSGAVVARELSDLGWQVEVFERSDRVGGHSRAEVLNGVVYEPNGAHIFHTSNERVADYVQRHGLRRPYQHKVLAEVFLDDDEEEGLLLSWPPQISELEALPIWPTVSRELADLPTRPSAADFEGYVVGLMGPTLYRLFIRDYTFKQWARDPSTLSSSFAPKRVELRDDGNRRLFRDRWEFFPRHGVNSVIESILAPVAVTCGASISINDLESMRRSFDVAIVTAPLDDFVEKPNYLEWRGVHLRARYSPTPHVDATVTPAYVVNRCSARVPYTRTVETKHATGQRIAGTVVCEEYPGAPARHYPVPTVDRQFEELNEQLKSEIRAIAPLPVFFCGRLANYAYINQDQAIEQAFACTTEVSSALD